MGSTIMDHDVPPYSINPITCCFPHFFSCNTQTYFPVSCCVRPKRVFLSQTVGGLFMEKSKSFPEYSCSYTEFGYRERSHSYNFNGPSQKGSGFCASNDPELKRKKRIKGYNVLTVEGKIKTRVRNSFKWIKKKFGEW